MKTAVQPSGTTPGNGACNGRDIGLALDGDADRLIVADEKGRIVDGDQLMALIALGLHHRGELKGEASSPP